MPGPAPKRAEDRARRNAPPVAEVVLPAAGYDGPVPEWPLPGAYQAADRKLWATLWRTPQAAAWARMGPGVVLVVANYVRLWRGKSSDSQVERRQAEDRLGLNPLAMRRLGWDVERPDPVADQAPDGAELPDDPADPYAGLTVVK
jgi:hypothetical protein